MRVIVDTYTRTILTAIAVLLVFTGIGMWCQTPDTTPTAYGKIVDSGRQLELLITELKMANENLADIHDLLASGKVKVQLDDKSKTTIAAKIDRTQK